MQQRSHSNATSGSGWLPPAPAALALVLASLLFGLRARAAADPAPAAGRPAIAHFQENATMPQHAAGSFDVKVTPLTLDGPSIDPGLGRFALEKQFHGELEGTGSGQMLTAGSPAQGSGGYVAMERFRGTLHGRPGSFVFQHSGTMTPAGQTLVIAVVPGSGSEALAGIAGQFTITIAGGKHTYELVYTLPAAP